MIFTEQDRKFEMLRLRTKMANLGRTQFQRVWKGPGKQGANLTMGKGRPSDPFSTTTTLQHALLWTIWTIQSPSGLSFHPEVLCFYICFSSGSCIHSALLGKCHGRRRDTLCDQTCQTGTGQGTEWSSMVKNSLGLLDVIVWIRH